MAYREFENSPEYIAPDVDLFPKTLQLLQTAQLTRQRQQQQNRSLAATYQADKLQSKFTTDQEELNHLSNANTQEATRDMLTHGVLTKPTREKLSRATGYKQESDAQWQLKEDLEKGINDRVIRGPKAEKNYYDKSYDQQQLIDAAYGKHDERVTWNDRASRLNAVASSVGSNMIHGFNKEAFVNDYVDELKTQERDNTSKSTSGVKTGSKVSAVFFDNNGVPKVTDDHAIQMLDSSPDLKERYKQEVDLELLDDARKMMATKDGGWVKSLTPEQVVQKFREDPSLNTESKLTPGERERTLAKHDLEKRQRINLANSYDAGEQKDPSGVGITNDKLAHSFSFHSDNFAGPGGVLPLKTGKNFTIASTSPDRTDISNGQTTHSMKGKRDFAVEGYQLVPTFNNNEPLNLTSKTPDEMVAEIKKIPLDQFNPANPKHLTDMKLALRGTSIDKAKLLQKSYSEERSLNRRIADAVKNNLPADQIEALEKQRDAVKKINAYTGKDELTSEENSDFQSLLPFIGIDGIEYNELVQANPSDIANVKAVTGGFDPSNKKNWDEGMTKVQQAFNQRKQEAISKGYQVSVHPDSEHKGAKAKVRKLNTVAIPEGRIKVKSPDGKIGHLPAGQLDEALKSGFTRIE